MEDKVKYEPKEKDNVHSPNHYKLDGLEPYKSIDVIKACLTEDEFKGFCLGNVFKYLIRFDKKGGKEDLEKARVYLDWSVEVE